MDFLKDIICPVLISIFISFLFICSLFGTVVEKIERLESYHSNVCHECGQIKN